MLLSRSNLSFALDKVAIAAITLPLLFTPCIT